MSVRYKVADECDCDNPGRCEHSEYTIDQMCDLYQLLKREAAQWSFSRNTTGAYRFVRAMGNRITYCHVALTWPELLSSVVEARNNPEQTHEDLYAALLVMRQEAK